VKFSGALCAMQSEWYIRVLSDGLICLWWLYCRNSLEISGQAVTMIVHYLSWGRTCQTLTLRDQNG